MANNIKTYYDTLASVAQVADSDIIVVQTSNDSDLTNMKKTTVQAIRQPIVDMVASNAKTAASNAGSYVSGINVSASGAISEVLTKFDTTVTNSTATAPTSKAVKDYVQGEITSTVASNIQAAVNSLDVGSAGGNGKYIKSISEEDGKIIPVEQPFVAVSEDANNAPSASHVKSYVDSSINSLDVTEIGDVGTLIQSVKENDGKISAKTIAIDNTVNAGNTGIPTSTAVEARIGTLNSSVGNNGTLIQSVTESSGVVSATTIDIDTVVSGEKTGIPTTIAVNNKISNELLNALGALDFDTGRPGYYVDKIYQRDGWLGDSSGASYATTIKKFDTYTKNNTGIGGTWDNNGTAIDPDDNNVPTSKAVKEYVEKTRDDIDYTSKGSNGSFVQQVSQTDGKIDEVIVAFENSTLASYTSSTAASYSGRTDVAPTVRAVTEQIDRLDDRIDALDYTSKGSNGSFVQKVKQTDGKIEETIVAFENSALASYTSSAAASYASRTDVAPTVRAVTEQIDRLDDRIDALDYTSKGSAGSFVQKVKQTDGKIEETIVAFESEALASMADTEDRSTTSSYASRTDVAPNVKIVADQIKRLDERIDALDYESSGANGKFVQQVKQTDGKIEEIIIAFENSTLASYTSSSEASYSGRTDVAPTVRAVTEQIDRLDDRIDALDYESSGAAGKYIQKVSQVDGKIEETVVEFDHYANASWSATPTDDNVPSSLAVENRIKEAKRQILEESEALTYIGTVNSKESIASRASAASRAILYDSGDVYLANGDFNLTGGTGITGAVKYRVRKGDMIVVNTSADTYNKDIFDVIGGSDKTVIFDGTVSAASNIPIFTDDTGIGIEDSGYNVASLASTAEAASTSASLSASAAACAASSASFASAGVKPYREAASTEASWSASFASYSSLAASIAASYAKDASDITIPDIIEYKNRASELVDEIVISSNAAVAAQTGAEGASDAAVNAQTGAEAASNAAVNAQTGAEAASNAAVAAQTGAEAASNAAVAAQTGAEAARTSAEDASDAAVNAQTGAEAASNAAVAAQTGAEAASNAAVAAQTGAEAASNAAVNAQTGAEDASNVASNNAAAAITSATAAAIYETNALTGSTAVSSYAVSASGETELATGYEYIAMTAAASAASYETNANNSKNAATGYENAAMTAAASAADHAANALISKTDATGYENAAMTAATAAASYATDASGSKDDAVAEVTPAGNAAASAADYATAASDSKDSAVASVTPASTAAASAASYADTAYAKALLSTGYENAAMTAAASAADHAANALISKTDATDYENAAMTAAASAASYATAASGSADVAVAAVTSAMTAVTPASSYSTAASKYAEDAVGYQTTAAGAYTAASSYSEAASASADVAVAAVTKAMTAVTPAITPAAEAASYAAAANGSLTSATAAQYSANTAANKASEYAQSASGSANSAISAITAAMTAVTPASSYAACAASYADDASAYKTNASNSESAASNFEVKAGTAADKARDYAVDAASYATDASGGKELAGGYAYEALTAATAATDYADTANLDDIRNDCTAASAAASNYAEQAQQAASSVSNMMPKSGGTFTGTVYFGDTDHYIQNTGDAYFNIVHAEDFQADSSRKLKENIIPTTVSALDLIDTVDIVDFNYIADDEKTPHIGFIAEDTNSLLSTPHLNSMDYTNCIGVLFKAIQEITKGMAELEKRIK